MIRRVALVFLASSLGLASSCTVSSGTATPTPTAPVADSSTPSPSETPADDPGTTPAPANDAKHCNTDADCGDGVCEGLGCGENEGVCAPKQRMCTRDLRTYCGCDGAEFRSSGSCPGKRFANEGPCAAANP
jgi:hypothetical protein